MEGGSIQETKDVQEVRSAIGKKAETMGEDLQKAVDVVGERLKASEPMSEEEATALVTATESDIKREADGVLNDGMINRTQDDGTLWYTDLSHKDLEPIRNARDRALNSLKEANDRYRQFMLDVTTAANETAKANELYKTYMPALRKGGEMIHKTVIDSGDPANITRGERLGMEAQLDIVQGTLLPNSARALQQMAEIRSQIAGLPSAQTETIQKFLIGLDQQLSTFNTVFGIVGASANEARDFVDSLRKMSDANYKGDGQAFQIAQKSLEDARRQYLAVNADDSLRKKPAGASPKDQPIANQTSTTSEDSPS